MYIHLNKIKYLHIKIVALEQADLSISIKKDIWICAILKTTDIKQWT